MLPCASLPGALPGLSARPLPATAFAGDAARWRAVQARDAAADGVFVYGVRTTRIYCRPNCKARLARRANVVFFGGDGGGGGNGDGGAAAAAAAEAAGFRPCKRCRPQAAGTTPADGAVARVRDVLAGVAATGEAPKRGAAADGAANTDNTDAVRPAALAAQARVSRWHFHRTVKQVTGLTPAAYLQQLQQLRGWVRRPPSEQPGRVPDGPAAAAADGQPGDQAAENTKGDGALAPEPDMDWRAVPLFGEQGVGAMQDAWAEAMAVCAAGAGDAEDAQGPLDDAFWLAWPDTLGGADDQG